MTKYFSSYTNVVRALLGDTDKDLSRYIYDKNIEEVWLSHDNWNGGIDFYRIVIKIPLTLYTTLRKNNDIESSEKRIFDCYMEAMRGGDDSLQINNIVLRPSTDDIPIIGENFNDLMWRSGFFRLFISHLSSDKIAASNLKTCLTHFGIDSFVAHEDITPSKEWEKEIENALFTMDALCAIVAPDFIKSKWCDQEVGIALGQRKSVIPIDKGEIPYGFFGKYQALKSKNKNANDIAKEIWNIISKNESTKELYLSKLVSLIINAKSDNQAIDFLSVLHTIDNVDRQHIETLHLNYHANSILNSNDTLKIANTIFKKYGLTMLSIKSPNSRKIDTNNLPF